jgi:hypothetical protein
MHDSLGHLLMIEMGDLFTKVKIVHDCGTPCASLEGIVVITHADPLIGGKRVTVCNARLFSVSWGDAWRFLSTRFCKKKPGHEHSSYQQE